MTWTSLAAVYEPVPALPKWWIHWILLAPLRLACFFCHCASALAWSTLLRNSNSPSSILWNWFSKSERQSHEVRTYSAPAPHRTPLASCRVQISGARTMDGDRILLLKKGCKSASTMRFDSRGFKLTPRCPIFVEKITKIGLETYSKCLPSSPSFFWMSFSETKFICKEILTSTKKVLPNLLFFPLETKLVWKVEKFLS
jgi:hypothetical protein